MAFAMYFPFPHGKRLKSIDEHGKEDYETVDHWQQLGQAVQEPEQPSVAPSEGPSAETEATADKAAPNPADAIEKLYTARGELDIIIDVIRNVEEQQFLTVSNVPKPKARNVLADFTAEERLRLGRKQAALKAAARRLQAGVATAKELRSQASSFFTDLSRLQRFWKIRLNPSSSSAPYHVDLSLGPAVSNLAAFPVADAQLDVLDDEGSLRMQVEGKEEGGTPSVHVGAWRVHQLLKQRQEELMWCTVRSHLQQEAAGNPANAFLFNLANMVVSQLRGSNEPELLSLRALLLHHFWFYYMGGHGLPSSPNPRQLLEDLNDWLFFLAFKQTVLRHLDRQAIHYPSVALVCLPCWQPQTGVIQIELQPGHNVLLIVRQNYVQVEGVASRSPGTRWTRDTLTTASEDELEWLLTHLVEEIWPRTVQRAKRLKLAAVDQQSWEGVQASAGEGKAGEGAGMGVGDTMHVDGIGVGWNMTECA